MGRLFNPLVGETNNWAAISTTPITLGTPVTNGVFKRLVMVWLICTSTGGNTAYVSVTGDTIATSSVTATDATGNSTSGNGGLLGSNAQVIQHTQLTFLVDPNATYTVSAHTSGGGTVSVDGSWAVDF